MAGLMITNTMLGNYNKKGILKADAHGYRTVILGGFGTNNESGIWYDAPSAVAALNGDSVMRRKLEKNMLFGEADHPNIDGLSPDLAIKRLLEIKVKYKSHKIREIRIIPDKYKDFNGRYFVAVEGDVAPSDNEYGRDLEKDLSDPHQNTAFSIRSLLDTTRSTPTKRFIKIPITWDRVDEPGIAMAMKYYSPACEGFNPLEISKFNCDSEVVMDLMQDIKKQGGTENLEDIMFLLTQATQSNTMLPLFLK